METWIWTKNINTPHVKAIAGQVVPTKFRHWRKELEKEFGIGCVKQIVNNDTKALADIMGVDKAEVIQLKSTCDEQAREITRLKAENAKLRAQLKAGLGKESQ